MDFELRRHILCNRYKWTVRSRKQIQVCLLCYASSEVFPKKSYLIGLENRNM